MADNEDNEVGLPQKGLNMIIKEVIPEQRIANECRELVNLCCVEFVKHVAREAQNISSTDHRKTIYHEHVRKALSNLMFPPDYIEAADSVLGECKIAAEKKLRRKNSRLDKCGIPEEELYAMQQELIEKARQEQLAQQAAQMAAMNPGMTCQPATSMGYGMATPAGGVMGGAGVPTTATGPAAVVTGLYPMQPSSSAQAQEDDEYDT